MSVRNYSAGEVAIIIGDHIVGGYADGTFATLERTEDSFTTVTGADGKTSRAKSSNRSGLLTLNLLNTSPSNEVLSSYALQDEADGTGFFPVLVRDNSGGSRHSSATGWVRKPANAEYAKELTDRQWLIDLADLDYNITGTEGFGT